ncbi:MAG: F0F1 ATP synthase subunit B [Hyphomicrobiaceae bacterium]|nr:F0F1 ATP synthase subunit B [Hyphomicrobiaceae bacterium]
MGAEFWVAVAFFCFVGLLLYVKVPALMGKALDERADAIRKELDEARRLREEAQDLLADYKQKQRRADDEAKAIIEQAEREAQAMKEQSEKSLKESLERRSRLAEEKIARAEAQALAEVRAAVVEAATAAAERVMRERVAGGTADTILDQSIRDLRGKLN